MKGLTKLLTHRHLQGHLIKLGIALDHQFLEGDEVVDCSDLIYDLLVQWVRAGFRACLQELLLADAQLGHQFTQQIIHHLLELIMNSCVLKLIFILSVKHQAVFIEEGHYGRLPTGTPQKVDNDIEEPVLQRGRRLIMNRYTVSLLTLSDSVYTEAIDYIIVINYSNK